MVWVKVEVVGMVYFSNSPCRGAAVLKAVIVWCAQSSKGTILLSESACLAISLTLSHPHMLLSVCTVRRPWC